MNYEFLKKMENDKLLKNLEKKVDSFASKTDSYLNEENKIVNKISKFGIFEFLYSLIGKENIEKFLIYFGLIVMGWALFSLLFSFLNYFNALISAEKVGIIFLIITLFIIVLTFVVKLLTFIVGYKLALLKKSFFSSMKLLFVLSILYLFMSIYFFNFIAYTYAIDVLYGPYKNLLAGTIPSFNHVSYLLSFFLSAIIFTIIFLFVYTFVYNKRDLLKN